MRTLKATAGGNTLLAVDLTDGRQVVVRTVQGPDTPSGQARFQQEVTALERLAGAPADGMVAVGRQGGYLYFAMPYLPGVTLEERLTLGPLPVGDALVVGRRLMETLADAHGRGVLHRDVRPSNVIVEPVDGGVARCSLGDFGVAYLARAQGSMPESRLRTARYASPEAAGLVAHDVDERSDLYSAGAVLFECLAGRPPFTGDTVGEVLRQHVTEPVPSLRSLGVAVPGALDEVVQRLLRKEPAERYSSARAVLADLDEIATALEAGDANPTIVVGAQDRRRTLTQPAFVGRADELAVIEAEIEHARDGRGGLVLVEGESGRGKTRLLDELARRGAERGVWVLRGQGADQMAQRPLRALDGVVDEVLHRAATDAAFVEAVRTDLDQQLPSMSDALPRLAKMFEALDGPGSLGPEAYGEARSLPALSAFLDALGDDSRPAVVVLDDCQWADELTLKLVTHWAQHREQGEGRGQVVLVVAFRSEEVPAGHRLRLLSPVAHVALAALTGEDVRRVLVSMAGPLPDEAVAVVEQLCEGNPFMATAVLRGLVETGALVEEPAGWRVEPAAMADVQTSRHAAAFLSRRLELLPPQAQRLLSIGAVLGKEFDSHLATALAGQSAAAARLTLDEARRRHILWTHDGRCVFVHDKIREALLDGLADDDRRALHGLAALAFESDDTDRVFELAYHFDAAGEAERALPYALAASARARAQHALEVAERQYRIAERGAASAPAAVRKQVAEGLGEVLMLRGHYEEAAVQLRAAGALADTDVDRAKIEGQLGELAFKRGDVGTASEAVERAVRLLGRRMPRRGVGFLASALCEIVVQALHSLLPGAFVGRRAADAAGPELLAVRLYSRLAYIYWFQRGRIPCLWAHLREMNLAERYPPTPELAQAYSEHAPVMTMLPWNARGMAYAERSLRIRTDLGDLWGQGQSLHFYGVVLYAASRYQECIDRCRQAATLLDRTGDCWESNTAKWHIAFSLYRLGDLAGAVEAAQGVRRAAVEIGDLQAAGIALGAWAKASSGDLPGDVVDSELARLGGDVHTAAEVLQAEAVRLLGLDRPAEAVEALERADAMVRRKGLKQEYVAPVRPWLATALRTQVEALPAWSPARAGLMRRARRASRRAMWLSRSYKNNQPHALRESALLAAIGGREHRARRRFDQSLRVAESQGARQEHAQTLLARGRVGLDFGWPDAAESVAAGSDALAQLAPPAPLTPSRGTGEVTLSLLDRFDSLLSVGQQIASALTPAAVFAAVRHAGLALLRAEGCTVFELAGDPSQPLVPVDARGCPAPDYSLELVARALAAGRPVVPDARSDDGAGEGLALAGVRSAICAPIFSRGRAVAVFYLTHGQVGALFGTEEVRLAEFIATLAGAALENAEGFAEVHSLSRSLEKRVEERTTELAEANRRLTDSSEAVALLRTLAVATNDAPTVEAALQVVVDHVCGHTGWPVGHVSLVSDGPVPEVVPTDIWHVDDHERFEAFARVTDATSLPLGTGLSGGVAATGRPTWICDLTSDDEMPGAPIAVGLGVRAGCAVPIRAGEAVMAVLELFSPDALAIDQPMLDLVSQIGTELGRTVERKRAEEALRDSEERTRFILAAANDAFVGMDEQGAITDWNRSAEVIFGWSDEEAIGRSLAETIVPEGYRQAHIAGLGRFLATGTGPLLGKRIELTALHRDGREFPAELSIWHSGMGQKHSFNAFVQDITERKRTEHDLAVARDQAMEASRMKSQFLATMSHEIRTPMNGVIGLAELLLDTDLGPHQRPYAEGLRTAGGALLAVINDILDFSKIEAGKLVLEDVEFDPHEVVDGVVNLVADTAHAKGLEIVADCSGDLPSVVLGDPGRLRQVLVNLASNAVKFTESGEVVLRATRVGVPFGDWVTLCFEVCDTGIGIDGASQERILEPFSQADASTTRHYGGTGLGLAISKQLTEAMGGTMVVESVPGQGSTFRVAVPVGCVWGSGSEPVMGPELAGVRALVVDDNATSRSVLRSQMLRWGMQVEVAGGPEEALRLLGAAAVEGRPVGVAVVDVAMPGLDGIELARRMAATPAGAATRVLPLTSRRPLEPGLARELGFSASVTKPVRPRELRHALVLALASEPTAPPAGRSRRPEVPAGGTNGDRGRVLVVEDNPTNQLVAVGMLTRLGYGVEMVSNGVDAVEAVGRNGYAAVLMDCNMPGMDGYEATGVIRRRQGLDAHVPIIAMTASALVGDRDRCLAAGMDDYLCKPVTLDGLGGMLARWTEGHERGLPAGPPTEAPPADAPPAIDADQFEVLRSLDGGDGAFLAILIDSFISSATGSLATLERAATGGDGGVLATEAHRLKGEAATLGAVALADLCRELECLAPGAGTDAALAVVGRLGAELDRVRVALAASVPTGTA